MVLRDLRDGGSDSGPVFDGFVVSDDFDHRRTPALRDVAQGLLA